MAARGASAATSRPDTAQWRADERGRKRSRGKGPTLRVLQAYRIGFWTDGRNLRMEVRWGVTSVDSAGTDSEMTLLDHFVPDKTESQNRKSVSRYILKIARLGGYLARAGDAAPGNIVMWRGLSRLSDIELGALSGAKIVGN